MTIRAQIIFDVGSATSRDSAAYRKRFSPLFAFIPIVNSILVGLNLIVLLFAAISAISIFRHQSNSSNEMQML